MKCPTPEMHMDMVHPMCRSIPLLKEAMQFNGKVGKPTIHLVQIMK